MFNRIKKHLTTAILMFFVGIIFTNAEGIVKEWTKDFETTTWEFIDYFDLTGKYYNYPEHKRGFKELDDYYLIVLKSNDNTDEILKISKEGILIKKISLANYSYPAANYIIRDNDIIAAREVYENSKYILKLEKYDFNLNVIGQKEYAVEKKSSQNDYIKIHNNAIQLVAFSYEDVSVTKYDYNFNKVSEEIKLEEAGVKSNFSYNESAIAFSISNKVLIYDSIKEKIVESPSTNVSQAVELYGNNEYSFNGDGRTIGNSYYYKLENGKYKTYNLNDQFIMENSNSYFYDLHGHLAVSLNGWNNSQFTVYDSTGKLEMNIDMFIITSDGFLTLKRTNSSNTKIERYKIKYSAKIIPSTNGQASIEKEIYDVNEVVKINISPESGYIVGNIKVTDIYGQEVDVNNDYTFKMPGSDATIEVTFVIPPDPPEEEIPEDELPQTGQSINIFFLVLLTITTGVLTIIIFNKNKFKKI